MRVRVSSPMAATALSTGLLQRQCDCGTHTLGGEGCEACSQQSAHGLPRTAVNSVAGKLAPPVGREALPSALNSALYFNRSANARSESNRPLMRQSGFRVSEPTDFHEREADYFAEQIMRQPVPNVKDRAHQRSLAATIQRQHVSPSSGLAGAPPVVTEVLSAPGQGLDAGVRDFMETRFGSDFSHVRVHTDAGAAVAARSVDARAFTVGNDVVFGRGQYDPNSERGRNLLAHELVHTMQQDGALHRKPLTAEEKIEDLQSPTLKDDMRVQQAFDNSPALKKPEKSEGVKTLQRALRDLGYSLPISFESGDADGDFGDETFKVVKQFQHDNHLSEDGDVGRDTLRAMDRKFNPKVTIEKVFFSGDRRELVNTESDWTARGGRYVDWPDAPYHVLFQPGNLFAESIPLTLPAGRNVEAMAKVKVEGGIPGRTYSVKATPLGQAPGWTLTGEASHREGFDTDYVFLTGDAALENKLSFQELLLSWQSETFAGTTSAGISGHKVFVTSGPAFNTAETSAGDTPNTPTFKRMTQAMKYGAGIVATQADQIVYQVFRRFPNYGVCDVPTAPNTYGITCPVAASVWEMAEHERTGNFQCITISRYVNAVLNVLGVPHAVPSIVTKPVVIWADPAHKEEGIDSDYPHPGINIPSIRHPRHPEWALGLLDGKCGVNNYEACIKLQWTPLGRTDTVVQYYCGGLGESNPREGFKTPREVLESAFVLSYHVLMSTNDPRTGFPRGIRKEDVKVYNHDVGCFRER